MSTSFFLNKVIDMVSVGDNSFGLWSEKKYSEEQKPKNSIFK